MRSLIFLFVSVTFFSLGQKQSSPTFLGINPYITVEPFYAKGELDINLAPFVFQKPIGLRFDFRVNPILNLGIRTGNDVISHVGGELALPVYLRKKNDSTESSSGFFLAPVFSLTRNLPALHTNYGIWAEPGYHLLFENQLAFSFGLQVGATYFDYDHLPDEWGSHFGAKVTFGKWF